MTAELDAVLEAEALLDALRESPGITPEQIREAQIGQQAVYAAHKAADPEALYTNGPSVVDGEQNWLVRMSDEQAQAHRAWQAAQPAARWQVPKLVIVDRLIAAKKINEALAALDREPVVKMRWDACVAVDNDDPSALALFAAIGADPAVILAPST